METIRASIRTVNEKSSDQSNDVNAKGPPKIRQLVTRISYFITFTTLLNFGIIFAVGHFRDLLRYFGFFCYTEVDKKKNKEAKIQPIFDGFTAFYYRAIFIFASDTINRPLSSIPSTEIEVLERKRSSQFHLDYKLTGKKIRALNFGSYNYLG